MEIWNGFKQLHGTKRTRIFPHSGGESIGIESGGWTIELSKAELVKIVKQLEHMDFWTKPAGDFECKFHPQPK